MIEFVALTACVLLLVAAWFLRVLLLEIKTLQGALLKVSRPDVAAIVSPKPAAEPEGPVKQVVWR